MYFPIKGAAALMALTFQLPFPFLSIPLISFRQELILGKRARGSAARKSSSGPCQREFADGLDRQILPHKIRISFRHRQPSMSQEFPSLDIYLEHALQRESAKLFAG